MLDEKNPFPFQPRSTRPNSRLYKLIIVVLAVSFTSLIHHTFHNDGSHPVDTTRRPSGTNNPAYLVKSRHGAVASENKVCSDLGVRILKEGGNALDAAISSSLCVGVVNPFSSGIGGGGFMTVRLPPSKTNSRSEVWSIDYRETAPSGAHENMFRKGTNSSRYGGLAVGVPGDVRGYEEAHRRWGSLPWKKLFLPNAALANGFPVGVELARRLPWFADLLLHNPDWSPIFAPEGALLQEYETLRNPKLAESLEKIGHEGADGFYTGSIADSIVRKVRETGGIITHQDLKNYSVDVYRSLEGTYLDKTVYVPRAPTSGPGVFISLDSMPTPDNLTLVLLHMLNIIEHCDFSERNGVNAHRVVEVLKYGFAARTRISDPRYRNDTSLMDEISTQEFSDAVFLNLTDHHVSVIDKDGMAVALTSTINGLFGSQVLDSETGIILNNEMDDFSVPGTPNIFGLWPSPYNYPGPHKRPLSSTVPTIIERTADGSFFAALGGSGGSIIFGALFQVLVNLMHWGMDLGQAVEAGRVHDQLYPAITMADDTYPVQLVKELVARGHNVTVLDVNRVAGVINTVMQDEEGVMYGEYCYCYKVDLDRVPTSTSAASDSRKNGIAAGY
ncbi:hypothetical protein V5O48_000698 [Marasmius crinis-equi]|uniref:Glutathione hydrolase n=1 Tax=Marasmius crinis-equi TaxID=585013 RepID=A0ABR3G1K4_9AGAR